MINMMGFFMPYYTSMPEQRIKRNSALGLLCLLSCALGFLGILGFLPSAYAGGIAVQKAEARFADNSYQLSADFVISFNSLIDQALTRGIPLYFISEFTLTRPRWYWLDEVVTQSEQTIKLSYNTLTRQYRITRGSLFQNFSSLDDALRIIGHQSAPPIDAALLRQDEGYIAMLLPKKDGDYIAAARMRLDVTQLPKPLQVNALATEDWSLDSDWFRWIVRPAAAISAADGMNSP